MVVEVSGAVGENALLNRGRSKMPVRVDSGGGVLEVPGCVTGMGQAGVGAAEKCDGAEVVGEDGLALGGAVLVRTDVGGRGRTCRGGAGVGRGGGAVGRERVEGVGFAAGKRSDAVGFRTGGEMGRFVRGGVGSGRERRVVGRMNALPLVERIFVVAVEERGELVGVVNCAGDAEVRRFFVAGNLVLVSGGACGRGGGGGWLEMVRVRVGGGGGAGGGGGRGRGRGAVLVVAAWEAEGFVALEETRFLFGGEGVDEEGVDVAKLAVVVSDDCAGGASLCDRTASTPSSIISEREGDSRRLRECLLSLSHNVMCA